ncbi:hypothetical protein DICVIV_07990 [Dictyocaulus viviparus]|uniref:Uncharacterized protein n=1 Tax=Dictyocaulus viviparus TaxID=29172 RepID=A0A0D8XN30_DICVI|nr:hypothetical protein DICVIV_07990 [Dictyocaulus viviparus]
MDFTQKRKKAVNWCSQENDLIIELLLECYNTYYFKFSDGSKKGIKAVRDTLHEKWAEKLTKLGFAERTPAQVAEKIKKSIIITRKYINTNGENLRTGRTEELASHLRPLEKKLREEYSKQSNVYDNIVKFYDLLKDVKEESLSPTGPLNAIETECKGLCRDHEASTNDNIEDLSLNGPSHASTIAQVLDLPPVAPVAPFKNSVTLPSLVNRNKKRTSEEDIDDVATKRHRILDAEMELIQRKRHLIEMKIKYWEGKMKCLSDSST